MLLQFSFYIYYSGYYIKTALLLNSIPSYSGVSDLPSDAPSVPFNQSLLRVLLRSMLNGLPRVKTASALRWYCLLLIR